MYFFILILLFILLFQVSSSGPEHFQEEHFTKNFELPLRGFSHWLSFTTTFPNIWTTPVLSGSFWRWGSSVWLHFSFIPDMA